MSDYVNISRSALRVLSEAARSYLDDLESGLEDGTYDEGAEKVEPLSAALVFAETALDIPAPTEPPTCYVRIEGGLVQWVGAASAEENKRLAETVNITIIDGDNDGTPRKELTKVHWRGGETSFENVYEIGQFDLAEVEHIEAKQDDDCENITGKPWGDLVG